MVPGKVTDLPIKASVDSQHPTMMTGTELPLSTAEASSQAEFRLDSTGTNLSVEAPVASQQTDLRSAAAGTCKGLSKKAPAHFQNPQFRPIAAMVTGTTSLS